MSNMSIFIAVVLQCVSGTMTTISQEDETKIKSKQFSEFGSRAASTSVESLSPENSIGEPS